MNLKKSYKKRIKKLSGKMILFIFRLFPVIGKYSALPLVGPSLKRMINLDPSELTQTYVLNLNRDVTDKARQVVLPIDMMKQMVWDSKYRAIMTSCLCRTAYSCENFPRNHGCIFIGGAAKAVVEKHMGREASIEEALAHIDRGAELGLVGQAMWVEVEAYIFGFKREKGVAHWLEICFCCPCCCSAFKLINATKQPDIKSRFRSVGWKADIDEETCVRCKKCIDACPVKAISCRDNRIMIDEEACLGCGLCAVKCGKDSIKLHLETPLLATVEDYFIRGGLRIQK